VDEVERQLMVGGSESAVEVCMFRTFDVKWLAMLGAVCWFGCILFGFSSWPLLCCECLL